MLLGRPFLGPLCWYPLSNASVTSNHGPVRFLSSIRVLARKAEWKARGNLHRCCSFWPHQAARLVRLDTAVHLCFDQINRGLPRDPCDARTGVVRTPQENLQSFWYPVGPIRGPCGTGPERAHARVPNGALKDTCAIWHNQKWQNSHTGVVCGPTGPVWPL